ncbi:solute carrier family 4 member 11 isoform X3 [Dermatophagoides farinae]|uniref:solute carrier family 4 member 11 isoform X3 n=1 Tax=Dermatophagoides farinae TaxID=6954 RepID=UPI001F11392C|nr:solute carrier family 4 member 11-like isoform X3 [Dermatophagoides farinae]
MSTNTVNSTTDSSSSITNDSIQINDYPRSSIMAIPYDHSEINMAKQYQRRSTRAMFISGTEMITVMQNNLVPMKSFTNEIRSIRDVEMFLKNPLILLNIDDANVNNIIEMMIKKIVGTSSSLFGELELEQFRQAIYNEDNGFQFKNFIQGVYYGDDDGNHVLHDSTWCCVFATIESSTSSSSSSSSLLLTRKILITRLLRPTNFGPTLNAVRLIILIIVPAPQKSTKNAFEIARTYATLMADARTRNDLLHTNDEQLFIDIIGDRLERLKSRDQDIMEIEENFKEIDDEQSVHFQCSFGRGIRENFNRRIRYYWSDYRDGLDGCQTLTKVCSSTMSLFFACILPCIAFGVLNQHNTEGKIGPKEALLGQAIGGLIFALFAGQPLVIISTTAPLCLYTSIVHSIASNLSIDFFDLFALVGIWNSLFLLIYSIFDLSQLMRLCTRSTEELFATFIFFAFTIDSIKECITSFRQHYYCIDMNQTMIPNIDTIDDMDCAPEKSILFLFLMLGTFALGLMLYNFSKTPYLNQFLRTTLADYSLPISVIIFTLIGSIAFKRIEPDSFKVSNGYNLHIVQFQTMNPVSLALSLLLGFALSMLFFIDQNVSAALVSAPANRLKKGDAYHWDLLIVAIINLGLSLIGYPWMHGILPHSPMHARSLADVITVGSSSSSFYSSDKSNIRQIVVKSRETRITGIVIHILIAIVIIFIPWILSYIPVAVLCGLFLYCAASTLRENSLYERILLFFTEQMADSTTIHWKTLSGHY